MTPIAASAPGKLVLLGDYAVLDGAPALALALARRARVTIRPGAGRCLVVSAPQLGIAAAEAVPDADGGLVWAEAGDAARLALVTAVWRAFAPDAGMPPGLVVGLDTAAFFAPAAEGGGKLGLGSSAALATALAGALLRVAGRELPRPEFAARLIAAHGAWQGGRGSGVDIAASLAGGPVLYRRGDGARPAGLAAGTWPPAGAACLFVWSGISVSTGGALARLAAWRAAEPAAYARCMGALCCLAEMTPQALAGPTDAFVELVRAYAGALDALETASGLVIHSPRQRALRALVEAEGAAFKPCGAGGDFGMIVADGPERLEHVRRISLAAGFAPRDWAPDAQGLEVGDAA